MKTYKIKNYKGNLVESLSKFQKSHKGTKIIEACEDGEDLKIKTEESKKLNESDSIFSSKSAFEFSNNNGDLRAFFVKGESDMYHDGSLERFSSVFVAKDIEQLKIFFLKEGNWGDENMFTEDPKNIDKIWQLNVGKEVVLKDDYDKFIWTRLF